MSGKLNIHHVLPGLMGKADGTNLSAIMRYPGVSCLATARPRPHNVMLSITPDSHMVYCIQYSVLVYCMQCAANSYCRIMSR